MKILVRGRSMQVGTQTGRAMIRFGLAAPAPIAPPAAVAPPPPVAPARRAYRRRDVAAVQAAAVLVPASVVVQEVAAGPAEPAEAG